MSSSIPHYFLPLATSFHPFHLYPCSSLPLPFLILSLLQVMSRLDQEKAAMLLEAEGDDDDDDDSEGFDNEFIRK
jgi:hypothetical protein